MQMWVCLKNYKKTKYSDYQRIVNACRASVFLLPISGEGIRNTSIYDFFLLFFFPSLYFALNFFCFPSHPIAHIIYVEP